MPQALVLAWSGEIPGWMSTAMILIGGVLAGFFQWYVLLFVLRWLTRRWGGVLGRSLVKRASRPLVWLSPFPSLLVALNATAIKDPALSMLTQAIWVAMIIICTWLLTRIALAATDAVQAAFPIDVANNRRARRMVTLV